MKKEKIRQFIGIIVTILLGLGVALAGSQGGYKIGALPIYGIGILLAYLIQWVAFIPAYLYKTEKFFDLTGSITYITVMAAAVSLTPEKDLRAWTLLALVSIFVDHLRIIELIILWLDKDHV